MASQQYRTVVRHEHPRHREIVILVCTLAALVLLGVGYVLGSQQRAQAPGSASSGALPQGQARELEAELTMLRTRYEVDRAALEMVRSEIASQKLQIAELEEGIQFYRSLMAPGEIDRGLSLGAIELVPANGDRRFAFRLVAQQEARKHSTLEGELYAEVLGTQDGERRSYPLSQLSEDVDSSVIRLRFKYFQSIEGELELPEGFEPSAVTVIASATKPNEMEASAQYAWQPQERFTHVGR